MPRLSPSVARWGAVAAATAVAALGVDALGIPGPTLFAALVVGVAYGLRARVRLDVGPRPATGAQAVTGVALGAYLQPSTLQAVGSAWLPVLLVTLATLALTLAAGAVLARVTSVDRPTAALGMVAGGASGIVAMADELGADGRLVAVMQYLRVLVIVLLTPVLVRVAFPEVSDAGGADAGSEHDASLVVDLAFTAGASVVGVLGARAVGLAAGSLLGPLIVSGALTLAGLADGALVPAALAQIAFALIGLQVGLRFTPATLRQAGALVGPVLGLILALVVLSAGLAAALAPLADVTFLDAYLATTPGGLYAVLATALGSGANTTFVLAVQIVRLFVMLLAAPPLVRLLARGPAVGARRYTPASPPE